MPDEKPASSSPASLDKAYRRMGTEISGAPAPVGVEDQIIFFENEGRVIRAALLLLAANPCCSTQLQGG